MVEMEHVSHIALGTKQNEEIEQAVRTEGGRLLNFIKRQVRDDDDARDIFQDVFSQLVEAYRGFETIERVTSWLFRVARNKIADLYRRPKVEPAGRQQAAQDTDEVPSASLLDILPDLAANPEDALQHASIWEAIEGALEELPAHYRDVFVWHEFDELSFRDMAAMTGETENTLRMRKYHAVQLLRARLADYYMDL